MLPTESRPSPGTCRCGHEFAAHEHLRRGTDCAFRDQCGCEAFTSVTLSWWRRLFRR